MSSTPQQANSEQADSLELQQSDAALAVISQLAANPEVDPNIVAKWLEMYERLDARRRQQAYTSALVRLQEDMPQIVRNGVIPLRTGQIKYAKLEDIDTTIRPMLAAEGLAFSFGSHSEDGKLFKITATLSHREGHSEEFHLHVPLDTGPGRSAIQAVGSTLSYAKRLLIKMALHIVEKDEDQDGANLEPISEDQLKDLASLMVEVGADETRFLKFMAVDRLEDILMRDLDKAITALERKRK